MPPDPYVVCTVIQRWVRLCVWCALALTTLDIEVLAQQDRVIDFRTSDNFVALYRAGLRPWKASDEIPTITNEPLSLWLPDSRPFRMLVDRSSFNVLKGDALSSANLYNEHVPVDEAVAHTKEIAAAIGASPAGLDEMVRKARTTRENEGWGVDITKGDIDVRLVCEAQHFPRSGLQGNVNVFLNWKRTSREIRQLLRDEPVKPPPGYEHLSMDPPPVSKEPWPKFDLQHYKDLNKQARDQQKAQAAPQPAATPSIAESNATPDKMEQERERTGSLSTWLWAAIGIAALLTGAVIFALRKRGL